MKTSSVVRRSMALLLCVLTVAAALPCLPLSAAPAGIVTGGDFEAAAGDAVYAANWNGGFFSASATAAGVAIVSDPGNSENHCLKLPAAFGEQYLKKTHLAPSTTYSVEFDLLGGSLSVFVMGSIKIDGESHVLVSAGNGQRYAAASETWKHYAFSFTTSDDTVALDAQTNFVIGFVKKANNPQYGDVDQAVSYIDNVTLRETVAEIAEEGLLTGGSFEWDESSALYASAWNPSFLSAANRAKGVALTENPLSTGINASKQCLLLPANTTSPLGDLYLKNTALTASTAYELSFDVYGGTAILYLGFCSAGGGVHTLKANTAWTHYDITFTTKDDQADITSHANFIIAFIKRASDSNEADTYLDNVILKEATEEQAEAGLLTGGSFEWKESSALYSPAWEPFLNAAAKEKGIALVTNPKVGGANVSAKCLKLPANASAPIGDTYLKGVALTASADYVLSFDLYGGAAVLYLGQCAQGGGVHTLKANTVWTHYDIAFTAKADQADLTAHANFVIDFLKRASDSNEADTYLDNVMLQIRIPATVVEGDLQGGTFEDDRAIGNYDSWNSTVLSAPGVAIVENPQKSAANNSDRCLSIPKDFGAPYLKNVTVAPNTLYCLSLDLYGDGITLYLNDVAKGGGSKKIIASPRWLHYEFVFQTKADTATFKNFGINFIKNSTVPEYNVGTTYLDNVLLTKVGFEVPDLTVSNGTLALATAKDPAATGDRLDAQVGSILTVTATPNTGYILDPGSLTYTDTAGNRHPILNRAAGAFGTGTGTQYAFVLPEKNITLNADYVSTATQNFRLGTVGTSVFYPDRTDRSVVTGLRFLNRMQFESVDLRGDTLTVTYGGTSYTVTEFGTLLKRTATVRELTLENADDGVAQGRIWKSVAFDGNTLCLDDYTATYLDFTVIMKIAAPDVDFSEREYTARGYLVLTDGKETITVYTDALTDTAAAAQARVASAQPHTDDWRTHPQDFKLLAFGFDDEPNYNEPGANNTTRTIQAFAKYDGAATLFVQGTQLNSYGKKLLEYALENGFELGNHTNTHPRLPELDEAEIRKEITAVSEMLQTQLNYTVKYLRPGFTAHNYVVDSVCQDLDITLINGLYNSFGSGYYTVETGATTAQSMVDCAYDGAIYICHLARQDTADAIESALADLYAQGYRFCTVSELFEYKGAVATPGVCFNEVLSPC